VRRSIRRPRRRTFLVAAVAIGLAITAAVWVVLPSGPSRHPRQVIVEQAPPIAPVPTTIGFHDPDVYFGSDADIARAFDAMQATNVRAVRLMIPWAGVEPTRNQFDWSKIDRTVDAAASRHMMILGVVNASPAWAVAPNAPAITGRPASATQYADFCAKLAQRYRGIISAYEIWNEPNGAAFFAPAPDAAGYTELLKAAYPRIKAADPSATVLGGALGSVIDRGTSTINPVEFVQQMYAAGAKDYLDALSFHPYQYTLKFSDGYPIPNSPMNQVVAIRQLMLANGDASKKIWATEYGEPATEADESGQAAFITDLIRKWPEMPYAGPIMIHTTRDRRTGSADPEDVFGVYRSDGSAKPAATAMKDLIAAGTPRTAEYQRFSEIHDEGYGEVLSPVFRATPEVWAQTRTEATLYETPSGIIASPNPVADKARLYGIAPKAPFQDGYQDMDSPAGVRIWWSPGTGAHSAGAGIVEGWTPRLGLAISDEQPQGSGVRVDFEHGYVTWQQGAGATAHVT
jgi:polysaccharide biosynthesis protein PslG